MGVAPIPVLRLLSLLRPSVFVGLLVIFDKESPPRAVLVTVPIMVVLVFPIVDADLNGGALRRRGGDDGHRCHEGGADKQ